MGGLAALGFIVLIVSTVSVIEVQRYDGVRINLAGRQRMLSQRMSMEALLYEKQAVTSNEVVRTVEIFDQTLRSLLNGGEVYMDLARTDPAHLPPLPTGTTHDILIAVQKLWEPFQTHLLAYLSSGKREHLEYIVANNRLLLDEMDQAVRLMQVESERNNAVVERSLAGVIVLIFVLLAYGLLRKIREVQEAQHKIADLEELLPICANCKKIRLEGADPMDQAGWVQLERYMSEEEKINFTHSICPDCTDELYPGMRNRINKR